MDRLILWDVDGTLLSTDGIAAAAMRSAIRQVVGPTAPMERTAYAGKTDWQIIREHFPSLGETGVDTRLHEFRDAYLAGLEAQRAELQARSRVFAGARQVLEALQGRALMAPLTGNMAAIARIKLEVVGLAELLELEVGAYGDDHHARPELVPVAVERVLQRFGRRYSGLDVVIVGDTPYDIGCGKANGARTVAVATGPYRIEELGNHDPDAVLPDLTDTATAVAAIMGG
ncbi:MAG: HAD hydrolase-like protein [Oscillochloris sp.]|nr:HAD hydrolase-like protein [Oscillochloris sp.]